jgi:hypothetical protein
LKSCDGLIHIGANEAQERNHYKNLCVKRVIYIEADPEVFKQTTANIKDYKGYVAYNYLVTDKVGRSYFLMFLITEETPHQFMILKNINLFIRKFLM